MEKLSRVNTAWNNLQSFVGKNCFISYSKTILACMWDFNIDPVRLKVGKTQRMLALLNTVMNNCLKVLLMTQSKVDLNVRERERKLVVLLKISQAIFVKEYTYSKRIYKYACMGCKRTWLNRRKKNRFVKPVKQLIGLNSQVRTWMNTLWEIHT